MREGGLCSQGGSKATVHPQLSQAMGNVQRNPGIQGCVALL